jgi:phospholipase C
VAPGTDQTPAVVDAFPLPNTAQATHVTQSWAATHAQINGGAMDGFVTTAGAIEPMGYYSPQVLPFAYSLADQFTLANQWFCSLPGPTYPNRRFLLAGTAYGGTVTDIGALLDKPPPNGTICDRLSDYNINWCNYFTDIPMTMVVPSIIYKHPRHFAPLRKFFNDCQAGTLPAVSFVDPGVGVLSSFASHIEQVPLLKSALRGLGANFQDSDPAETEEDPQDMYWGEAWAATVVQAVLDSETWKRTLLIYTYDMYGPRVPAIVVSPYSTAGAVTNTVHDHTSVLATIEAKWNVPALTARDANANDVMDFLDLGQQPRTGLTVRVPPNSGPSGPVGPERTAS